MMPRRSSLAGWWRDAFVIFPQIWDCPWTAAAGWTSNKLCQVVASRHRWADRELIVALVSSDSKHRYEIRGDKVRARYGHSVDVQLDHPENRLARLYYGASEEEADRILEIGIKPASQRYVHLSTTPEKAWHVATFRTGNPRVIQVDAAAAQASGVKMMTVSDDIVISEMIPAGFLGIMRSQDIHRQDL